MDAPLSAAATTYVTTIYLLREARPPITTTLLAHTLGIASASVTTMVQRLVRLELVAHAPYHHIQLTDAGERVALAAVRRRRLLKCLLVAELGYSWDEVEAEVGVLESAVTEKLVLRLAEYLKHPTTDPHGDAIPFPDGTLPPCHGQPLTAAPLMLPFQLVRVSDQRPNLLRYLASVGLTLHAVVSVRARAPFDGPVTVVVQHVERVIDSRVARHLWGEPLGELPVVQHSTAAMKDDAR